MLWSEQPQGLTAGKLPSVPQPTRAAEAGVVGVDGLSLQGGGDKFSVKTQDSKQTQTALPPSPPVQSTLEPPSQSAFTEREVLDFAVQSGLRLRISLEGEARATFAEVPSVGSWSCF